MKVGVDSYSYHRFFGDVRVHESDNGVRWSNPYQPVEHARSIGAECVYLETIFLPAPDGSLNRVSSDIDIQIGISWHHSAGLATPNRREAEDDLHKWIEEASTLENNLMRITAGSPETREIISGKALCEALVQPLRKACDHAAQVGLQLALENHGDLNGAELHTVLDRVDRGNLGVCIDTVNALRLGDDVGDFVALHAPRTRMVQLKDCIYQKPYCDRPGGPVTTALGEGELPLPSLLNILTEAGFRGPVCVELATLGEEEVDELAMLERSIAWLKDHRPENEG